MMVSANLMEMWFVVSWDTMVQVLTIIVHIMEKELVQYCWTTLNARALSHIFGIVQIQDGQITTVVIMKTWAWIAIDIFQDLQNNGVGRNWDYRPNTWEMWKRNFITN